MNEKLKRSEKTRISELSEAKHERQCGKSVVKYKETKQSQLTNYF